MQADRGIVSTAPAAPGQPAAVDAGEDDGDLMSLEAVGGLDACEGAGPALAVAGGAELRPWRIEASLHGERLDRALALLVPEFSRSYLQQLIADGAVLCQGQALRKPSQRMTAGQAGTVELRPTPQSQAFVPQDLPLQVVYEDAHLRVIDKAAGMVVHPAPGHWSGTLLNALLARDPACASLPRAGIVHRLDRDTSGLMVVARTRLAMEALVRAIAAREVHREYLAIAHGAWHGEAMREVQAAIGRDPRQRLRMAVVDLERHAGKPAATRIARVASTDSACLVHCTLRTGRTHQIRVHMAHLGHPLVSDAVYGGVRGRVATRQALHAWRLSFRHPVTGQDLAFESPLPEDLRAELAAQGLRYNEHE